MLRLTLHRLWHTVATLVAVSVLTFGLIQLPPGDFADAYANKKYQAGAVLTKEDLDGVDMRWGNGEAALELTIKIGENEGCGSWIRNGVRVVR